MYESIFVFWIYYFKPRNPRITLRFFAMRTVKKIVMGPRIIVHHSVTIISITNKTIATIAYPK